MKNLKDLILWEQETQLNGRSKDLVTFWGQTTQRPRHPTGTEQLKNVVMLWGPSNSKMWSWFWAQATQRLGYLLGHKQLKNLVTLRSPSNLKTWSLLGPCNSKPWSLIEAQANKIHDNPSKLKHSTCKDTRSTLLRIPKFTWNVKNKGNQDGKNYSLPKT